MDTASHLAEVNRRWKVLQERLKVKQQHIDRLDLEQVHRLLGQAGKAASRSKALVWLRKAADAVTEPLMDHSACKSGCSHCCHVAVAVSDVEARWIAKEVGVPMVKVSGCDTSVPFSPDHKQNEVNKWTGKPCPFLKSGRCSIYAFRPLACRKLLNLDDDELLCILVPGENVDVPYLNMLEHDLAAAMAFGLNTVVADIREWFPA